MSTSLWWLAAPCFLGHHRHFIREAGMAHIKEWKCLSGRPDAADHALPIQQTMRFPFNCAKALRAKRQIRTSPAPFFARLI